jgi:hypothetical protein
MTTTAIKTNSTLTTTSSTTSNKQSSEEPPKKVNFSLKKIIKRNQEIFFRLLLEDCLLR